LEIQLNSQILVPGAPMQSLAFLYPKIVKNSLHIQKMHTHKIYLEPNTQKKKKNYIGVLIRHQNIQTQFSLNKSKCDNNSLPITLIQIL